MSRPTTPEQRANRARITARGPRMPGAEPVASVPAARRRVEDWADEIGAVVAALRAAPAPEGETPNVSMDVLNGVTVAGARAFWALKDLETRHERLRVAVMSAVSVAELGHPNPTWAAIRADLAAAFNADTPTEKPSHIPNCICCECETKRAAHAQAERELMTLAHGDRLLPDASEHAQIIADRINKLRAAPALPSDALGKLAKEATNGWACYARTKREHADIARLHSEIDKLRAAPAPTLENHHHYQPSTSDANICGICGDGPWGIHRFQPMREECKICAPESLLIASSVEVHCPHCGEGQPAPDGSLVWTPEELERGAGRCRCCACEQDIAIVHGKAKVE
jgi:hypothetical protein